MLSSEEQRRAARFHFERDRRRFIGSHAALREILSLYLGEPPASLEFVTRVHGKPELASGAPRFNLSHSGELALIGVAGNRELGVDVERVRAQVAIERIARRFFSASEAAALFAYPGSERDAAFFRCWTRKEAYVKARGGGLRIPLASFDVSLDEGRARLLRAPDIERWTLHSLAVPPGYVAAAVVEGEPEQVGVFDWREEGGLA